MEKDNSWDVSPAKTVDDEFMVCNEDGSRLWPDRGCGRGRCPAGFGGSLICWPP